MPTWTLLPCWHKYPTAMPRGHLLRQVSFLVLLMLICVFRFFLVSPLVLWATKHSSVRLIRHIFALIIKASWLFSLGQRCGLQWSTCWTCTLANRKPAYVPHQALQPAGLQLHGVSIWLLLQLCWPHGTLGTLLSWILLPFWSLLTITTWWAALGERQCLHLPVSNN